MENITNPFDILDEKINAIKTCCIGQDIPKAKENIQQAIEILNNIDEKLLNVESS